MNRKCKQYLLKKFLVRIDFDQAQDIDVDNAIQKVRDKFFDDGYKLFQNVVPLTSIQQESGFSPNGDSQFIPPVSIINETVREYLFKKELQSIKFSNKYLIIEDLINNDYKGSKSYSQLIYCLMDAIHKENAYITLTRIGLRKFDSLIFKEINNINMYFDSKVFNQRDSLLKYQNFGNIISDASSKISIISQEKSCKGNIITEIQTGEYTETRNDTGEISKTGQAIQAILDIDIYKDSFENIESFTDYILNIYNLLNEESYSIYKSALTEKFYNSLLNGTVNDSNILGGVYDVQYCE